jgi:hypothetical protein
MVGGVKPALREGIFGHLGRLTDQAEVIGDEADEQPDARLADVATAGLYEDVGIGP